MLVHLAGNAYCPNFQCGYCSPALDGNTGSRPVSSKCERFTLFAGDTDYRRIESVESG
uniref:Uncharacterized protein n=1 Tax=Hyaloperonospora arabidopsidis (strain Emoy2) TaxID=559515 RepID=M4BSC3_HYAAE